MQISGINYSNQNYKKQQPAFGSVELYKTVSIPLVEEDVTKGPISEPHTLRLSAKFRQAGAIAGEVVKIHESFNYKEDLFVFEKERQSEKGIFDFFVADGDEGEMLKAIKKAGRQIDKFHRESMEETAKIFIMNNQINEMLVKVQDMLIQKIKMVK